MKKDILKVAVVLGLIMAGLILAGCGESRSQFAGTYKSVEPFAGKDHIDLELQENGKGTWTLAGKTVEFTWVVNDGKIWIYTKPGAILIVTPTEGGKILSADMTGDWHPGCPPGSCVAFKRVQNGG
jgi:outer membrane lipoprotein-sorting protein